MFKNKIITYLIALCITITSSLGCSDSVDDSVYLRGGTGSSTDSGGPCDDGGVAIDPFQCYHAEILEMGDCYIACGNQFTQPCELQACELECDQQFYAKVLGVCGLIEQNYVCMLEGVSNELACVQDIIYTCGGWCDALCTACPVPNC